MTDPSLLTTTILDHYNAKDQALFVDSCQSLLTIDRSTQTTRDCLQLKQYSIALFASQ